MVKWLNGQGPVSSATVAGGYGNDATGYAAAIGGGSSNVAAGSYATVPGGRSCEASTDYSFAAGHNARTMHTGSFVWADSKSYEFLSSATNSFDVRATGGVRMVTGVDGIGITTAGVSLAAGGGSWSSLCDRNAKEHFQPVNPADVLAKVAGLPMTTWNYKTQDAAIRHLGPMAQDFYAAFGVGEGETTITGVDADGVALAAIQGLYQENQTLKAELDTMKARLARLEELLAE